MLQESRKYYYLSIRRILINKNADYYVSIVKKVWNNLVVHRIWSSNVFSRSLRLNEKIAKFLVENKSPFSLLAKLQVYNYDNKDEVLFVESKPILVVPGARGEDVEMIIKWEGENTLYEEEVGFFPFRYLKRISLKNTFLVPERTRKIRLLAVVYPQEPFNLPESLTVSYNLL